MTIVMRREKEMVMDVESIRNDNCLRHEEQHFVMLVLYQSASASEESSGYFDVEIFSTVLSMKNEEKKRREINKMSIRSV